MVSFQKIIFFGFLFLFVSYSYAQRILELRYEEDAQGNYTFFANNRAFCNYILEVNFTSLDNAVCDQPLPFRAEIKPGNSKLFKLSKVNASNPMQFKYQTANHKGCLYAQADTSFVYLLPISVGKEAQAYVMDNGKSPAGEDEAKNWYVIRIKMNPGDTIYSARRGMVTEVDDKDGTNDAGKGSIGSENFVEINHADCSFGRYGVLRKGSALVHAGQFVEAGTPIGIVGGDKFGRGSEVRFSVYYHIEEDFSGKKKDYWVYILLNFWIRLSGKGKLKQGGTYISEWPLQIRNQELKKTTPAKGKTKQTSTKKKV
jgi:hypothetical protein